MNLLNAIGHWLYAQRDKDFLNMIQAQMVHKMNVDQLLSSIGIDINHDFIDGSQCLIYEYLIGLYRQRNEVSTVCEHNLVRSPKNKFYMWNPRKVDFYLSRDLVIPWNVVMESFACRLIKADDEKFKAISEDETINKLMEQPNVSLCNCHTVDEGRNLLSVLLVQARKLRNKRMY